MKYEIYLLKAKFAGEQELANIYQVYLEAYQASKYPISGLWTEGHFASNAEQDHFILCEENGVLKGFIFYSRINDEDLEVWNLSVSPDKWGKAVGSQMLDFLQNHSGEDYRRILLEVHEKNAAAIGLYTRKNWKIMHRRKNYYQDQGDAVLMSYFKRT